MKLKIFALIIMVATVTMTFADGGPDIITDQSEEFGGDGGGSVLDKHCIKKNFGNYECTWRLISNKKTCTSLYICVKHRL